MPETFFIKVAGLRPATLLKKCRWHRCFPVNLAKFLRTSFFTEHLWWLLLLVVNFIFCFLVKFLDCKSQSIQSLPVINTYCFSIQSHRNQSINLQCKPVGWFLYDRNILFLMCCRVGLK